MSKVVMHNVVSVDGFIADDRDDIGPLFDWYFNGDVPLSPDGALRMSRPSFDYVRPAWDDIGCMVIGRRLFDVMDGWQGQPPVGDHVVVVSHRPKPDGWHPEASYHFVDDVATAVSKAAKLAGDRTVAVAAGDVGGQAFAQGLVDEVAMDVVPVVFGSGKRYFGPVDRQHLLEDPDVVIRGDRVLHLRYRFAGDRLTCLRLVEPGELLGGQVEVCRRGGVADRLGPLGSRDRYDDGGLRELPRQGHLLRADPAGAGDVREGGMFLGELLRIAESPQRAPGQERQPELVAYVDLRAAAAEGGRELVLHADQRGAEDLVGGADLFEIGVREPDHPDLAGVGDVLEAADHLVVGHVRGGPERAIAVGLPIPSS